MTPAALAGLALLLTVAPVRAADPAPGALNLTATQQQKLAALESASRTQSQQLIGQIGQLRKKLADLYAAFTLDVTAARRANGDLNRLQGQLLDLRLSEQQQLRGILSEDQFNQIQATIRQHDFHNDHNDSGHGGPPHGHRHWPDHPG